MTNSAQSKDDLDAPQKGPHEKAREALKRFRIVFSSVKKHFEDIEAQCGVSGAQLWALWEIHRAPGLRVSELANALLIHQSTASNLLVKLEEKMLIHRERDSTDQRVVKLHLTEKGTDVIGRAPRPMIGLLPDALQRLPEATLDSLLVCMDELVSAMQIKDDEATAKPLSDL